MKTLYLDCSMGAAGDMLLAALLELLPDPDAFLKEINGLGLPGVTVCSAMAVDCGITGTHVSVKVFDREESEHGHDHHGHTEHHHSTMAEVCHVIDHLCVSDSVKNQAKAVYGRIAAAESKVHGQSVELIHFHEVGALDAIADVVGVCLAVEKLSPVRIMASPVHVGCGHIACAHGLLPVPAPAAAELLKGVPIYGGCVQGELCTPTGAAILTHFVEEFGSMPVLAASKIGCGMGSRKFDRANCLRAFLGDSPEQTDTVVELSCNLDDMTGEAVGFAMERLFACGALDVFAQPVMMKKSRPGTMLTCICHEKDADFLAAEMFRHTTTLGIRRSECRRYIMERTVETVSTPYGDIDVKHSSGYGVSRAKAEYDQVAKAARAHDVSLAQVLRCIPEK